MEADGIGRFRSEGVPGLERDQSAAAIVRPEAISVTPTADGRSGVTATVVDLAYLGHEVSCLLEMPDGGQVSMSLRQQVEPIEVGRSYAVSWRADDVWLLARDDAGAQAAA